MSNKEFSIFSWSGKGAIAVCLLGALLAGCAEEQAPEDVSLVRPVKTLTLLGAGGTIMRQFPGRVRAAQRVDLSFQVPGKLIELPVREGQVVSQGDLIAQLDDRDYASNLRSAQAEKNNATANFKRAQSLIKDGHISKTDYDTLQSKKEVAQANLSKVSKAMDDTKLSAPFTGRVASRLVENFQDVQAKQPIISLQDIQQLEILVNVPESRAIRSLRPGMQPPKLYAVFDGLPGREFTLTVKEFSTEADPNTQTFEAVLAMPQPEGLSILPGMTAMVWVKPAQAEGVSEDVVFIIPAVALFADEAGMPHVWVVDTADNSVHRRAIQTAELTGSEEIRVVSGLKDGETLAVSGVARLREGMEIRPVDKVEF